MHISQTDVAHLGDDVAKRLVVMLTDLAVKHPGPIGDLWRQVAVALVRVVRERRTTVLTMSVDMLNDDGPGAMVGEDDDPVTDALVEMREQIRRGEIP